MLRYILLTFVASGLISPLKAQEAPKGKGRTVAFLVGVNDYGISGLNSIKTAEDQIRTIEFSFKISGIANEDVHTLVNSEATTKEKLALRPTSPNILTRLKAICKTLQPEDTLVIVFTGHCARVKKFRDKGLMLLPLDVRLADEETMIPLTTLYEVLDKDCKSQSKLIFLAPCRSEMIDTDNNRGRIDSGFCPTLPTPPKSVFLVSACEPLEQTPENRDGLVLFFSVLAEGIAGMGSAGKEKIFAADVLQYIKQSTFPNQQIELLKGDRKAFESIVITDRLSQRKQHWSEVGSVDRQVWFEKNEPVATLLKTKEKDKPIKYRVANPSTRKDVFTNLGDESSAFMAGYSADGSKFFLTTAVPSLMIYETKTGKLIDKLGPEYFTSGGITPNPSKVCFSPNGEQVLCCDISGKAFLWSLVQKKVVFRATFTKRIADACFALHSQMVILVGEDSRVTAVSTISGRVIWQKTLPSEGHCIDISPDGLQIAVGTLDSHLLFYSTITGEKKDWEKLEIRKIWSVGFSHDGHYLVVCGSSNEAILWDILGKKIAHKLEHDRIIEHAAFSLDGSLIATCGRDKTIKIWETKTGKSLKTMEHEHWVTYIVFSPDAKKLVTLDQDWDYAVWNVETGNRLDRVVEKKKEDQPAVIKKD